jgi:hypothetical protein
MSHFGVSEIMCIQSLHRGVFIPIASYMTNTTIRVSKGIHNIAFTMSPDTFHIQVPK